MISIEATVERFSGWWFGTNKRIQQAMQIANATSTNPCKLKKEYKEITCPRFLKVQKK
jgi:hypothetical protein